VGVAAEEGNDPWDEADRGLRGISLPIVDRPLIYPEPGRNVLLDEPQIKPAQDRKANRSLDLRAPCHGVFKTTRAGTGATRCGYQ
jgi:hypothetical protein